VTSTCEPFVELLLCDACVPDWEDVELPALVDCVEDCCLAAACCLGVEVCVGTADAVAVDEEVGEVDM
jgi:hypothetical protein